MLLESGKPVVALLMNGRPLALSWEQEHVPAIVECWHLGIEMGNAVAHVLFGDVNPGGKLTCTFPAMTGQCPMYYNAPKTGRPGSKSKFTSRYLDAPVEPLYPFGYGLSYTEFAYSDMDIRETDNSLEISVVLKNTGKRDGAEAVQLYMQDAAASIVRPVKELKGFSKEYLKAGESREILFTLPKSQMGFMMKRQNIIWRMAASSFMWAATPGIAWSRKSIFAFEMAYCNKRGTIVAVPK